MLLPDDFIETLGPEPIGERGALGQRPGGGSGGVVGGEQIGHGPTLPQYAAFCTAIGITRYVENVVENRGGAP
jgi:hypothetical protein